MNNNLWKIIGVMCSVVGTVVAIATFAQAWAVLPYRVSIVEKDVVDLKSIGKGNRENIIVILNDTGYIKVSVQKLEMLLKEHLEYDLKLKRDAAKP